MAKRKYMIQGEYFDKTGKSVSSSITPITVSQVFALEGWVPDPTTMHSVEEVMLFHMRRPAHRLMNYSTLVKYKFYFIDENDKIQLVSEEGAPEEVKAPE